MTARVRPTSAPVHRAESLDDSWRLSADCRTMDPALWFPGQGETDAKGKAVCAGCPVRRECLEYAMTAGEDDGVWGGLGEDERRLLRKNRRRCALAGCTRTFERAWSTQRYCCDDHAYRGRLDSKNASRRASKAEERERATG